MGFYSALVDALSAAVCENAGPGERKSVSIFHGPSASVGIFIDFL